MGDIVIRIGKGSDQPKEQKNQYKSAVAGQGAAALLYSTDFYHFQIISTKEFINLRGDISIAKWLVPFLVQQDRAFLFQRGRSPPFSLEFYQKISDWRKNNMEGNHPKRRRDKYNPYYICELEGHYYISFQDGQGVLHKFEINRTLYEVFDDFELKDISYLHKWDKYIVHSEVWESTLDDRAFMQPESVEEIVLKNILTEKLHRAIRTLSPIQRRRLILYFYEGMTYEKIAEREGCSKMSVKRSIDAAIGKLRKILKK